MIVLNDLQENRGQARRIEKVMGFLRFTRKGHDGSISSKQRRLKLKLTISGVEMKTRVVLRLTLCLECER